MTVCVLTRATCKNVRQNLIHCRDRFTARRGLCTAATDRGCCPSRCPSRFPSRGLAAWFAGSLLHAETLRAAAILFLGGRSERARALSTAVCLFGAGTASVCASFPAFFARFP